MDPMLTLVGALMLVISIVLSPLSSRVGMPVLLIFLAVGMMMGEDGPGGIRFDDYQLAFLIANLALGVILLDGGMRTRAETFRVGLRPALVLATLGVFLTAAGAAVVAWWVFDLHWMLALLIGAIISSTDAAVVFSMLQGSGVHLNERVSATLEIESGSNDPMAIFLTLLMVTLIGNAGENNVGPALLLLVEQFGIGSIAGLIGGVAVVALANRMRLAPPLYPLLVAAGGIAVFSATNALGGSGFLAIYLTGVVIGNRPVRMMPMILQVHDGLAWLAQLCLFLMLGLLVAPSELLPLAGGGLILALALIFVIRPLIVIATLWPFGFNRRELGFISWVGLRGAVPIVLALFPIIAGLPDAQLVFHAAFFIVLVSLLFQGTTMTPLARWLKLEVPADNAPLRRFPLDAPGTDDHELMLFPLRGKNWELPRRLDQLKFPDNTAVAGVFRNRLCLQSQADLEVIHGDIIAVFATPGVLPDLNKSLNGAYAPGHLAERAFFGDFVLNGDALLGDVEQVYGIEFDELPPDLSLAECFAQRTKGRPVIGDLVALGPVTLVVRSMNGDTVAKVGLKMDTQQNAAGVKHSNTKDDKIH